MTKRDRIIHVIERMEDLSQERGQYVWFTGKQEIDFANEILEICKPKKDPAAIAKANITLTTLLNGLIKGDFFLEDFSEATILKLKVLLTGNIDNCKPRKLSKEKIRTILNTHKHLPKETINNIVDSVFYISLFMETNQDIWEKKG